MSEETGPDPLDGRTSEELRVSLRNCAARLLRLLELDAPDVILANEAETIGIRGEWLRKVSKRRKQ